MIAYISYEKNLKNWLNERVLKISIKKFEQNNVKIVLMIFY